MKPKPDSHISISPNVLLFWKSITRKLNCARRARGQKATATACAGSGFAILKTGICSDDDGASGATECKFELPTRLGEISTSEGERFTKPRHFLVDAHSNKGDKEGEEVCERSCTGIGEERRQQHGAAMPLLPGSGITSR